MMFDCFPLAIRSAGIHDCEAIGIDDAATQYLLRVARCTASQPTVWVDDAHLIRVEVSLFASGSWMESGPDGRRILRTENGWLPWGAFDAYGGIYKNKAGIEQSESAIRGGLNAKVAGRKMKVRLITAAPINTRLWLEVT